MDCIFSAHPTISDETSIMKTERTKLLTKRKKETKTQKFRSQKSQLENSKWLKPSRKRKIFTLFTPLCHTRTGREQRKQLDKNTTRENKSIDDGELAKRRWTWKKRWDKCVYIKYIVECRTYVIVGLVVNVLCWMAFISEFELLQEHILILFFL